MTHEALPQKPQANLDPMLVDPGLAAAAVQEVAEPRIPGYDVTPEAPQTLPLDGSVDEMATENVSGYDYVQLGLLQLGESTPLRIWATKNRDGEGLYKDTVLLSPATSESLGDQIKSRKTFTIADRMEPTIVGRNHNGKDQLDLNLSVSRNHLRLSLDEKGLKIEDVGSKFGTRLQATKIEGFEEAVKIDPHESVMKDPEFLKIYQPGWARVDEINKIYKEHLPALEAALEKARTADTWQVQGKAENDIKNLTASYEKAKAQATAELETALKPYLAQRLEQQRRDIRPGYERAGELTEVDGNLISARGKKIAWRTEYGKQYAQPQIRYGQLQVPSRFTSWAGSNGEKVNHKTGIKTTSSRHIVDLAAAMLSGNWEEEHEPIDIAVDPNADYSLPAQIRGKIKIYKPLRGFHRLAADRLIEGLDGVVGANVIER
jgi:hypothetical protein